MGKVWILDSETKGTGAHVAPLERAKQRARREQELSLVSFKASQGPAPPAPARSEPRRFRVIDVMGNRVLLEDDGAAAAIEALGRLRSALDARVYVCEPRTGRWRLLSIAETRMLWSFRGTLSGPSPRTDTDSEPATLSAGDSGLSETPNGRSASGERTRSE